ncbi:shikimate dehydrogenase [Desulfobacula sp.]|uniref:shikimate dehydrogenase n=1 Tax=Desulfobacula sp. TaxID=2593537 RepID=UPI002602632F|nr:shikimate dehydrogenase [Desulfobacula sp.]
MIDSRTHVYGVFGNPVRHSQSPLIHNACFQQHHVNAVYLAFEIKEISKAVAAMRTLDIKGASITIPFKEGIMECLDEIDPDAMDIGAVNTVVNKDGTLIGYNTDYTAAIAPLTPFGIKNKTVCVMGAGGAAQAVAYGIHKAGGALVIINRDKDRGRRLAVKYRADFISMEKINKMNALPADILINTTSIGMRPDVNRSPVPSNLLTSQMIVMDIVYTPLKTKLLSQAEEKGASTIDGLSMFVHQGAAQFNLWTGISPDIQQMRNVIIKGV